MGRSILLATACLAGMQVMAQRQPPPTYHPTDPLLVLWLMGAEVQVGTGLGVPSGPGLSQHQAPRTFGFGWNLVRWFQPELPGTWQFIPTLDVVESRFTLVEGSVTQRLQLEGHQVGADLRYYFNENRSLFEAKANVYLTFGGGLQNWNLRDSFSGRKSTAQGSGKDPFCNLGMGFTWARQASFDVRVHLDRFRLRGDLRTHAWVGLHARIWLLPPRK